jgi:hypothetical protein
VTFDRLELQGKLVALEEAITSGEGARARELVAELRALALDDQAPIRAAGN